MRIASFKIENYKSFRATEEIRLSPGFNVVVGQNNVGKTALVEALSLRFGANQHRSLETIPVRDAPVSGASTVTLTFEFSRDEILQQMARMGNFFFPAGPGSTVEVAEAIEQWISDANAVEVVAAANGAIAGVRFRGLGIEPSGSCVHLRFAAPARVEAAGEGRVSGTVDSQRLDLQLCTRARDERVYAFRAERLNIGMSSSGPSVTLLPNAANLPEVLQNLQGNNPRRFERLCEHATTIFPVVQFVSVRNIQGNRVEILVWTTHPQKERDDLAVTLAESGTGIGQVLAILYVVLTADFPQVILIDEPQSFLHPGAVRKLIEILKQHPQHQFIITTHSPTAVTAADPNVLLMLRLQEAETVIEQLNVSLAEDLRVFLAEIGARLSDVFGADNILWVEGRTEEECFSRIIRWHKRPLLGTAIVGVLQTGDFEGRRSRTIVEIYERLSQGGGLLPPAIAFIFDREGKPEREQQDLQRRSQGKVHFTLRRMYENYLLNPVAIAAVASGIEGFRDRPVTEDDVQAWLDQNRWNRRYFEAMPAEAERTPENWLRGSAGLRS